MWLLHSAKGSTWEEHKYVQVIDGKYYYPDSYKGGRHLKNLKSKRKKSGDAKENTSGSKSAEESKTEEVKPAVDPNDGEAVLRRINESLGRVSKSNVKAKGSSGKSSKSDKSSKEETEEKNQELAESYVEKLSDAKLDLENLQEEYKNASREEKKELKSEVDEARQLIKDIRAEINKKGKKNASFKKLITELTKNE